MTKVQAADDLTHSQNIPASEETARPWLSRGDQGHTDPRRLSLTPDQQEDGGQVFVAIFS